MREKKIQLSIGSHLAAEMEKLQHLIQVRLSSVLFQVSVTWKGSLKECWFFWVLNHLDHNPDVSHSTSVLLVCQPSPHFSSPSHLSLLSSNPLCKIPKDYRWKYDNMHIWKKFSRFKEVVHSTLVFQVKYISEVMQSLNKYDLTWCSKVAIVLLKCFN